ncbi:MAG: serine O-acetyltransferase [Clostridia bacterium]|nr:serine O-acetyltransferase [Clostridia bacterium]
MFKRIREDLNAYQERDPAAKSKAQIFFLYNGFHAVLGYRLSHWLYRHKRYFLARWVSQYTKFRTGVEIHPAATIGRRLCIDHGTGIVIGETCVIGDNCLLYQGVTLGGTGKETGKRHPTLEDNVIVGSGAKVLGPFTIGSHSKIAANAVVLEEIPPYSTAVGVPAKVVRQNGKKVEADPLDQVHIPDPIAQELQRLNNKIEELEAKLKEKENETV